MKHKFIATEFSSNDKNKFSFIYNVISQRYKLAMRSVHLKVKITSVTSSSYLTALLSVSPIFTPLLTIPKLPLYTCLSLSKFIYSIFIKCPIKTIQKCNHH